MRLRIEPQFSHKQTGLLLARGNVKSMDFASLRDDKTLVLELVIGGRHCQSGRFRLERFRFGGEIARNHVVLDTAIALEAQQLVSNTTQRRDTAKSVEPSTLVQLGKLRLNVDLHRSALQPALLRLRD